MRPHDAGGGGGRQEALPAPLIALRDQRFAMTGSNERICVALGALGGQLAQRSRPASTGRADSRTLRLSPEHERELVVATERGDREACRQLVDGFLPAIGAIARRFDSDARLQRSELIQEGVAGLLFAARRYDPRMKTPFWSYASFWVRKAMQELVAEVTRPVALSDHAVRGLAQIRAARREHLQLHGAEPTSAELAAATGFTRAKLESLLATDRTPRGFEESRAADGRSTVPFGETIADPRAEQEYDDVLDRMEVRNLAGRLDERERLVLWSHYGLGQPPQTLSKIGAGLGLTAERVRQIEADALDKLREAAAEPPNVGGAGT
jgi:RNA polymerase primary sigma factor